MPTKEEILDYLRKIKPELQEVGIVKLGLFGSYAKDKADIASDIDIVIESTDIFVEKYHGFEGIIYLEDLRNRIMKHFKIQADLCDIASMPTEKQERLLTGVIYV